MAEKINLPDMPSSSMFIGDDKVMTTEWQEFFRSLYKRVGGISSSTLPETLLSVISEMFNTPVNYGKRIDELEKKILALSEPKDFTKDINDLILNPFTIAIPSSPSPISMPGVSTDNAVVRWDGVTGNKLQNSVVIVDDLGNAIILSVNAVYLALVATDNIGVGDSDTMGSLTTGDLNTCVGARAGALLSIGDRNVFVGSSSGAIGDDTKWSVYVGNGAGSILKGGHGNVLLGYNSGYGQAAISGTTDDDAVDHLLDSTEAFDTDNIVRANMVVINTDTDDETTIAVVADGDLTLNDDIFNHGGGIGGENYIIVTAGAAYNVGIGLQTLSSISSGSFNVVIGQNAGADLRDGNYNVYIGRFAGETNIEGASNIFLGCAAGSKHTLSNRLIIDDRQRATEAAEITDSIIYGKMGAAPASQILTFNAQVGINTPAPTANLHLPAGTAAAGTAPFKLTTGILLATPEAGVLEFDGTGLYLTPLNHRRFISMASDSIIATTTATTVASTTLWTGITNADELKPHRVYVIKACGHLNNVNAAGVATITINLGATAIITFATPGAKLTEDPWHIDAFFTVRTIGDIATGTVSSYGMMMTVAVTGTKMAHNVIESIAVDTEVANNLTIKVVWSGAHADNWVELTQCWLSEMD